MSGVGLLFDARFTEHFAGVTHPERPQRLAAIQAGLDAAKLLDGKTVARLEVAPILPAEMEQPATAHKPSATSHAQLPAP